MFLKSFYRQKSIPCAVLSHSGLFPSFSHIIYSFLCYNPNYIYVWRFVYPNIHPVWTIYSNILTQISQSQKQLTSKKNSAMETDNTKTTLRPASLRWKILRQALLRRSSPQNSGTFSFSDRRHYRFQLKL